MDTFVDRLVFYRFADPRKPEALILRREYWLPLDF